MTDRERVIEAWKIFRDSNPYEICSGREFRAIKEPEYCMGQMIEDTIALLKEQEAIGPDIVKCEDCRHCVWATKPRTSDYCGKTGLFIKPGFYCAFGERKNLCKNCKTEIGPGDKYCRECESKINSL